MNILLSVLILSQGLHPIKGFGLFSVLSQVRKLVKAGVNSVEYLYSPNRRQSNDIVPEEYDFIIIGSGSAGSILANRLSENQDWKVLLLEAGNRANAFTEIPILAPLFQLTHFNWGYNMEKQEGICNAMEDGICAWPRGRALGGTTVINYMIYTRGNPIDYKRWESQGNPGWAYEDVLPFYLKSEDCHLGEPCNSRYHHKDGYLSVEYPFTSKLTSVFLKAGEKLGYRTVDYNTPDFMGFSPIQATQKRGKRHSVAAAFLNPIKKRSRLEIITSARVTNILINPETKAAYGVEFFKRKQKFSAMATKEVIVSAGTFHSPQLLMLSGIGPKEHLEELGIPLIKNLPVGETMYDHISYLSAVFTTNETIIGPIQALSPKEWLNWITHGEGLLTSLAGIEAIGYIKTEMSKEKADYPDIELLLNSIGSLQFDLGIISRPELRIKKEVYKEFFQPLEGKPSFSILPVLLHPKSKGYLKLRSANPFDPPLLYGNFYTDPENHDLRTMISAIRNIQRLCDTAPFRKLGTKQYEKPIPGCENHIFDTDNYWECALRSMSVTLHHQIATCKMGPEGDREAIVDSWLRVYGVKNLRVADSSVIPVTLSAHTNAPSMMIGEKLAKILEEDWSS
nr:glucose dehydrogenase [FAD, quinone]-like [Leptinotarsa decemlineata]